MYSFPFQTIQKALEPYGIYDLTKLSFLSDRGANLIKALEDYETLFCFPHRINNVLKTAFFQLKMYRTAPNTSTTAAQTTVPSAAANDINNNCHSSSASEDEEAFQPTKQIKKKKHKKKINH